VDWGVVVVLLLVSDRLSMSLYFFRAISHFFDIVCVDGGEYPSKYLFTLLSFHIILSLLLLSSCLTHPILLTELGSGGGEE
jgi:hypothetical protein